jgi:hypothetical protein
MIGTNVSPVFARAYYDVQDRAGWGEGPWDGEPDKAQWVDPSTDLDCLIVRNNLGALCGYVGLPPHHPYLTSMENDPDDLHVHGGITFGGFCQEGGDESHGVCHVPLAGRVPDVYWFGFDCSHVNDLCPASRARGRIYGAHEWPGEVYRAIGYVAGECAGLAKQLAGLNR